MLVLFQVLNNITNIYNEFHVKSSNTNYITYSPVNIIMKNFNKIDLDIILNCENIEVSTISFNNTSKYLLIVIHLTYLYYYIHLLLIAISYLLLHYYLL